MVKGKLVSFADDLSDVMRIRKEVFGENNSAINEYSIHVLVENDNGDYVATGAIDYDGEKYIISGIAVLESYRKQRYGDFVLRMLVNKAYMSGANEVYAECKKDIISFFEKVGFEIISDESDSDKMFHVKLEMKNFKTACGHSCGE